MHADVRKKEFLVLGEGPTQGSDDTAITTEAKYSINFTASEKKFFYVCIVKKGTRFKNLSIQSKGFRNKTIFILFKYYFEKSYNG